MVSKRFLITLRVIAHRTPHNTPASTASSNVTHFSGNRRKYILRRKVYAVQTEPCSSCSNTFPFISQHPSTDHQLLKSQLDESSL
ncbi:hypothetical protein CY34DRAFT_404841 [Suillus luteus UH-Slu-Lm8-n1]|uniref:Uncharacterized protein n=1 Tax=Suillus luteus UH-Slu-Lm8-n1 TaxID=930992 RepID=A0A0D0A8Z6_9AGAM|nr:hypothetical protein CY34DRAFT_404841 [Suillus luteus UH-Slu-Lm8-n1]